MKKKFTKMLGVALPLVMVLTLAVALFPASTPTAEAGAADLRFSNVPIPKLGAAGKYVLAPNVDIGPLALSTDGAVLFTAADITVGSLTGYTNDLMKSSDGGYTWTLQTGFQASYAADNTTIVDIVTSPEYASDQTMFVATRDWVYQSVDGGKTFSAMDQPVAAWPAGADITDLDVSLDVGGRHSVIIGTTDALDAGEVYVYSPATTGMSWQAQGIGGTHNVLAVAFSPNFASDEGIFAVTVNSTASTVTRASFGYTKNGGGWGVSVGDGEFRDSNGASISTTTRARIAFPDDFDVDSITSNIAFVGFVAGTSDGLNTLEKGDCYKVIFQPTASSTIDLNVRGLISATRTATNIYSLDVMGDAEAATIFTGGNYWTTGVPNYYWLVYYSTDSGETWATARKHSPTGGTANVANTKGDAANCNVLLAPDFDTSGKAYATTAGTGTSAFSRTITGGTTWAQTGLIDYGSPYYNVTSFKADAMYATSQTFLMLTQSGDNYTVLSSGAVWKTTNGGATYDRIFSYANPTVEATINKVTTTTDNTVFVIDYTTGKFWRSSDGGATFPRIITAKQTPLTGYKVFGPDTLATVHSNGAIWFTEKMGRPWWEPDESIMSGSYLFSLTNKGDVYLASALGGTLFVSLDAGKTFKHTLGITNLSASTLATFDRNWDDTKYIYAGPMAVGGGIWRIALDETDPGANPWQRIDDITNAAGAAAAKPNILLNFPGAFYALDNAAVVSNTAGGIWRSTNPDADIDGIYPPHWLGTNKGLESISGTGVDIEYAGYAVYPNTIFMKYDEPTVNATSYMNQLVYFADTLASATKQMAPDDKATDAGVSLNTEDLTMTVILNWESMPGATSYQYQTAKDPNFSAVVSQGYTTGNEQRVSGHITGETYYWRLRVAKAAATGAAYATTGAPLISPWSATRTYSAGSAVAREFKAVSPELGATGVDVMPTFVWTPYEGAIGYEIMVSEYSDFSIIEWSRSVGPEITFYRSEEALAYDTTYYWRARGVTGPAPARQAAPGGPWATGMITTMKKSVEPTPSVIIEKEPAPPAEVKVVEVPTTVPVIPDYLLWTIIVIGAVLIIALIVLIVRTRRVT